MPLCVPNPFRRDRSRSRSRSPATPVISDNPPPYEASASQNSANQQTASAFPVDEKHDPFVERPSSPVLLQRALTFSKDNEITDLSAFRRLAEFDTVFLIDDSGSMTLAADSRNVMGETRWEQTSNALQKIVPICTRFDSDGIDIHFLNNRSAGRNKVKKANEVLDIFGSVEPSGATPTGGRLNAIMKDYIKKYQDNRSMKPLNIICITDGEPSDPDNLEKSIVSTAKALTQLNAPARQIGVQFFQVGDDEDATESLVELDNALSEIYGVRDMIDTIDWKKMNDGKGLSGEAMLKAVLGAVDKKLDRQRLFRKWR